MEIVITESAKRLDLYLAGLSVAPSRSQLVQWIKKGFITLNKKTAKPSTPLKKGDCLQITTPPSEVWGLIPEKIPLDILYEDDDLLVLNKPAGLVVHPGAGHRDGTLSHALMAHCGSLSVIGGVERPGLVHRLDKGTSGLMVIAKNDETHFNLSAQFKAHVVKKTYFAIVKNVPKPSEGTIKNSLGRSPHNRKKFTVVKKGGRESITHYEVLSAHAGLALVKVGLETGRTHQIRVHFSFKGNPLVGDALYGFRTTGLSNQVQEVIADIQRPLLQARELCFIHPKRKKQMKFKLPMDPDFKEMMSALSWRVK